MITLLLVDKEHLVRAALRSLLETEPDFKVVGEAADGQEALRLAQWFHPRIVIAEAILPRLNGWELAEQVRAQQTGSHVLIISGFDDPAYLFQALKHGASGYPLKTAWADDLRTAVREIAAGGQFLSSSLKERLLQQTCEGTWQAASPREEQILRLVGQGNTNVPIAAQLGLSTRTVEAHCKNLRQKLGLRTQTELIRYAVEHSLVSVTV